MVSEYCCCSKYICKRMKLLGRRQVVTARGFDLRIPGSNPGVPAKF